MSDRSGFGVRVAAALIDAVILIVAIAIIGLILGNSWLGNVIRAVLVLGYYSQEIFNAATPGKKVMKIAIGGLNGLPATQDALVKRYLIKMVPSLIGLIAAVVPFLGFLNFLGGLAGLALFVGCFLVLGSQRQSLHDMLAETAVYPATPAYTSVDHTGYNNPQPPPPPPPQV